MKLSRILATAAMLACVGLTTTGCFSNKNKAIKDRLYIVYYPGGYGEEYLETFVFSGFFTMERALTGSVKRFL